MDVNTEESQNALISSEIACIHKKMFGKGPTAVKVKSQQYLIAAKAEGVLTQMERNLIGINNGAKRVAETRQLLLQQNKLHILDELNIRLGTNFNEVVLELFTDSDELILILC